MANEKEGSSDSLKPGTKVWYKEKEAMLIYIIPAHQWPEEHENKMDEGVRLYMTPPKVNPPQQRRESIWHWKKWREDMYIICFPPDKFWVSETLRVKLSELSLTPPVGKEPEKNGTRRLQKRPRSLSK
jgi:hypothetical protein